jgi:hypothetical protein
MRAKTLNNFDLDSFERFGDDLCGLLLSFLPISHKIKFECVSKQWKSLLFNRKQKLIITYSEDNKYTIKTICFEREPKHWMQRIRYYINTTLLEKVFKKFKYITHLVMNSGKHLICEYNNEPKVFELIANYCLFLEKFECNFMNEEKRLNAQDFYDFGLKCGQRLKYLSYDYMCSEKLNAFMPSINKIKSLQMRWNPLNANDLMEERFSKLEEISFLLLDYQNMLLFTDSFYSKIKKLSIHLIAPYGIYHPINDCLLEICRFENLKYFKIELEFIHISNYSIDESLKTIGKSLSKLKYLLIESTNHQIFDESGTFPLSPGLITGDLFPILAQFKTIQYLKICHKSKVNRFGSIQSLKSCENLKYLSIISDRNFSEEEIEEYKFHFSGLSYLEINCCNRKFSL